MATTSMGEEEFTVTIKDTIIEGHMVIIIIAMKSKIKFVEEEPIPLLSIALGFFSFADHSVVHFVISFQDWNKKKHAHRRVPHS